MSDSWYRNPPDLPPLVDSLGRRWTFTGECLDPEIPDPEPVDWADLVDYYRQEMLKLWAEHFSEIVAARWAEIIIADASTDTPEITTGGHHACPSLDAGH